MNELLISSYFNPEVDKSLNITCRKVVVTYCITKSYQFEIIYHDDGLLQNFQDTKNETLKPHFIHVYKVFG